ncbi:exodeoxyribonuclease VII large subunit [Desulfohalobiaceae bacterium Ax17]|uniref:exodeoxyribonuclease VII large subunit n=1 Tax=Desulfovulcanus ferrireducens TaxID=2831190 RepID=UPI00207B9B1E|nr:exodeoxyribonuclease VII large subunit [Desulfovulcanus ferrireducens]MBT8762534.1 exodeoxyribonuclease VII large subunit [Desulfovulcanus ferrireducens]
MAHIFSVSELTTAIKEVLEVQFPFVWVRGQVSNMARPGSGHIYFTLKDEQASIRVVWFKGSQGFSRKDGLSLAESLEDGQEVLCAGRIGVYPPRGTYQLIAELVQEQGLGDLFLAFEALKKKLAELGYFDPEHKKPIPYHPEKIAVITAPHGAAIQDFLRIAQDLGLGSEIRIYPSLVQGDQAPKEIVRAINLANAHNWAEVLVLIRGGGSLEDLWAFNTEEVAKAIFESNIPVLTGIGHEIDTTIADLVADKRAATPSHTAQLLWPERKVLAQDLDEQEIRLHNALRKFFVHKETILQQMHKALTWLSPEKQVQRTEERFEHMRERLEQAWVGFVRRQEDRLGLLEKGLKTVFGPDYWQVRAQMLSTYEMQLKGGIQKIMTGCEARLDLVEERLSGLDPLKPLARGYSLVEIEKTGKYLRRKQEVEPGDKLGIRLLEGSIRAEVVKDKEGENDHEENKLGRF